MRLTEFWERMSTQFGAAYARSLAADYQVPTLGVTVNQAIADGVDTKQIWRAVCEAFELPESAR